MIDLIDIRECVVVPALTRLDMYSLAAEQLVMATAAQESDLIHLRQHGDGPARGLWQMEENTYYDIWENYLIYREDIQHRVRQMRGSFPHGPDALTGNLFYACAMCRVHYYRRPQKLPAAGNVKGLARYWKQHYNTPRGRGTVDEFIATYNDLIKPLYEGPNEEI